MGRKIILLSDGTGNSSAKVWRTNVWRVFERLDLSGSMQVAFYDDGVGSAVFKPLAILGGAFGFGLKRNVLDLYKFACRNYRAADDEIFGFGFSRGAFTMRVVIGLIMDQGLVTANSEPELDAKAKQAYRAYRAANFHTKWPRWCRPEKWARRFRDLLLWRDKKLLDNRTDVRVRFLGLWDTVAAYGMPVDEMTRGISQWIWPLMLPNCLLDKRVQRACHALSIDDERTTFHPVLWDERAEDPLLPDDLGKRCLNSERISQVWFAGVHSNVGGGYPDDSLAQIPLTWIMTEAQNCGVQFKVTPDASPQTYAYPKTAEDKDGRLYDPRGGLGGYYRYGPRDISAVSGELLTRKGRASFPRIHDSVLRRIRNRAHAYAPIVLPAQYDVVTEDAYEVLPPSDNPYEAPAQATARWHEQEAIWNLVWWRRIVYFLTVAVSVYLFMFPVIKEVSPEAEFTTRLAWVSELLRAIERFLPAAVTPWINGYARDPAKLLVVIAVLVFMLLWSSRLARKIQSRMDVLWQTSLASSLPDPGLPTDIVYRIRTSPTYLAFHRGLKRGMAPAVFAVLFLYLGITFASHLLFNLQDYAGWVCQETDKPAELGPGDFVSGSGRSLNIAYYADRAKSDPGLTATADKNNPFKYLSRYNVSLPEFRTSEPCQSMRVILERNGKYLIRFESTDFFADWDGSLKAAFGYYSSGRIEEPKKRGQVAAKENAQDDMTMWQQIVSTIRVPLRRELTHPWLRVTARVGGTGGAEFMLKPDFSETYFKINEIMPAIRNGELFLFVNDAVIGVPSLYDLFYKNNKGSTRVFILRCGGGTIC